MPIQFSRADRATLTRFIKDHFPDGAADSPVIEGTALALWLLDRNQLKLDWARYQAALEGMRASASIEVKATAEGPVLTMPAKATDSFTYYHATAKHERKVPPVAAFTGRLSMARVPLPQKKPQTFQTVLGEVGPDDHLCATVDEVRAKFGSSVKGKITRADLITPPRLVGARFAAISVLLGYVQGKATPAFYVLEAGTATGNAKVTYLAPSFDEPIVTFSGYRPTPFTRPTHVYTGRLVVDGDDPKTLRITAHKDSTSLPYLKLGVTFAKTQKPRIVYPGMHIAKAAAIVLSRRLQGVKQP